MKIKQQRGSSMLLFFRLLSKTIVYEVSSHPISHAFILNLKKHRPLMTALNNNTGHLKSTVKCFS